jgi:hypothetical protein
LQGVLLIPSSIHIFQRNSKWEHVGGPDISNGQEEEEKGDDDDDDLNTPYYSIGQ